MMLFSVKKLVPLLTFFVVANPETFKIVRGIAGGWVSSADGLPTTAGLLLHSVVFVILCHFLWMALFGKSTYHATKEDMMAPM
jgi:hypothetical protein